MIEEKDILKYLDGTASKRTVDKVDQLVSQSTSNKEVFDAIKFLSEESVKAKDYVKFDTDQEWDIFQKSVMTSKAQVTPTISKIEIDKINEEALIKEKVSNVKKEAKVIELEQRKSLRSLLSIAASVAVLVTATWFLWPESEYIDIVDAPADTEIILEDGSTISIKKGANFKTKRSYKYETQRSVEVAGEVKFDIASDPEKPFIVNTEESAVEVLGTIFNVVTEGVESTVANEEGLVKFFIIEDPTEFKTLEEGEVFKYDGTGFIDLNEPEPEPEPEPIPLVADIMDHLRQLSNGKVTFGSGMETSKLREIDIDYKGKSPSEIIRLLEEKAIVSYTTSCSGCYQINEIILRR